MKLPYFDIHTHLQFSAFDEDRDKVIKRARERNVWIVNVGTQAETSDKAVQLAHEQGDGFFATVGLHPIHTGKSFHDAAELGGGKTAKGFTSKGEIFDFKRYRKMAVDDKVVGIGECGLDYYHLNSASQKIQSEVFVQHIKLAQEVQKPLMIHCRDAFEDLIDILEEHHNDLQKPPGIIHFFSGSKSDADRLLELGFYFTFGGVITFASNYNSVIENLPVDRLLSETDAPYVSPVPKRKERNEPSFVVHVVARLAEIKSLTEEVMKEIIFNNAVNLFKIDRKTLA